MDSNGDRLAGGPLNAAIANEIGRLMAECAGRGGPTRSRAFISHDVVVCLLEDSATATERTLVAAGKADLVRLRRDALQRAIEPQPVTAIERLTQRTVISFLSGNSTLGESSVELLVLETEPA